MNVCSRHRPARACPVECHAATPLRHVVRKVYIHDGGIGVKGSGGVPGRYGRRVRAAGGNWGMSGGIRRCEVVARAAQVRQKQRKYGGQYTWT